MTAAAAAERTRARLTTTLFAGAALGSTGIVSALSVSALAAESVSGDARSSGLPATAGILGAAAGASVLSRYMARRGRRRGLVAGYCVAAAGAGIAFTGVRDSVMTLLLAGALLMGAGNSANLLSRYAAADMYPPAVRASRLGLVVWSGTAGALIGPNLLAPTGAAAEALGLPALTGPYAATAAFLVAAAVLHVLRLRPDPSRLADGASAPGEADHPGWGDARVRAGVASVGIAQFVMVLVMTMTPVHVRHAGHGFGVIGLVTSAHVVGMYALSPLVGRLVDHAGAARVVLGGQALLVLSVVAAAALPASAGLWLAAPLGGLGLGWSASFVAGSALIATAAGPGAARVQGGADTLVWLLGAAASTASGVVLSAAGYGALCMLGAVLVLPAAAATARGLTPRPAAATIRAS